MGLPPQFRLTRKLIKNFFKTRLPKPSVSDKQSLQDILHKMQLKSEVNRDTSDYFDLNVDHDTLGITEEDPELEKMIKIHKDKMDLRRRMEKMHLERFVISELNPPLYRKHAKGKYKDYSHGIRPDVRSIYDGIKMK